MRQLLENAVYAPTRGRYKVYVIDEVHMLSNSAFNAMLKTLEEPPEHVKFILATTDPQKIPVTVLSRCLQFNLKQMPQVAIVEHLTRVLGLESVAFEAPALRLLARAAAGSMRDALSLLDQAIAHGAGKVEEEEVRAMLGTVDSDYVFRLFDALLAGDAAALLAVAESMAVRSLSFEAALEELAQVLVRLQVAQLAPDALAADDPDSERLLALAGRVTPEFVQLAYQIAIQGRQDLPFAPDPFAGFVMALLRLHAFFPDNAAPASPARERPLPARSAAVAPAAPVMESPKGPAPVSAPASVSAPLTPARPAAAPVTTATKAVATVGGEGFGDWRELLARLGLSGMVRTLAQHCELVAQSAEEVVLRLAPAHRHLLVGGVQEKLQKALADLAGHPVRLRLEVAEPQAATPAALDQQERKERQDHAVAAIEGDSLVREVIEMFDATIVDTTIKPIVQEK